VVKRDRNAIFSFLLSCFKLSRICEICPEKSQTKSGGDKKERKEFQQSTYFGKNNVKNERKKWAKLLKIAHRRRKHEERLAWNTLKNICCLTLTNVKSRASSLDTDGSTADVIKQHDGLKDKRNK
jgi:hypothetical protein